MSDRVTESTELILYGYSPVFDYTRRYDKRWMVSLDHLKMIISDYRNALAPTVLNGTSNVPYECLLHIFSFLGATSLIRASQTSKEWRIIADDEQLWFALLKSKYGLKLDEVKITLAPHAEKINSRHLYFMMRANFQSLVRGTRTTVNRFVPESVLL